MRTPEICFDGELTLQRLWKKFGALICEPPRVGLCEGLNSFWANALTEAALGCIRSR